MNPEIDAIIQESIRHELLISDLYQVFYDSFPMDSGFWWTLLVEEKNHAAVIRSLSVSIPDRDDFPKALVFNHLDILRKSNGNIMEMIDIYRSSPPTRHEALRLALAIEQSSAESMYQDVMSDQYPTEIIGMIQQINHNDRDHATRIQDYMIQKGIGIESDIT